MEGTAAVWQRSVKHHPVRRRATPVGRAVADDQPCPDRDRGPTSIRCNVPGQPPLPVERAEQFVHVDNVGLELDDKDSTSSRVPGKDVDRSPLAVDRERRLGREDPRWPTTAERLGNGLVQQRMGSVDEPVEIATPPSRDEVDADLKDIRDLADRPDPDVIDVAAFDPRDGRVRDSGQGGDIGLAPTVCLPDAPNRSGKA
jgi:hypothetical protein